MNKKILYALMITVFLFLVPLNTFATSVEYIGNSDGIISENNNFFNDIGSLMPGDEVEDYIEIKNNTNSSVEIFFKAENIDNEYLTSKINLSIVLIHNGETKEIYNGNLKANELTEYVSLGNYERGYDGKLLFKISLPKNLNNQISNKNADLKWIFMVKADEEKKNDDKSTINKGDNIVKYFFSFMLSVFLIIVLVLIKIRKDENN